jgi:hypothetical protein
MDELLDVVNNDGDTERHIAWFKSIAVRPGDEKATGPTVSMPGWVQDDSLKKVADFHEDLEHAPFFVDVKDKSPPGAVKETNAKRIPPQSMFFNLRWTFKPTKDWAKNSQAGKAAKKS